MILENGVIRTMDPSLPTARRARDCGRPDRGRRRAPTRRRWRARSGSTSAGRCVLPGFTDSHVHFATVVAGPAAGAARGRDARSRRRVARVASRGRTSGPGAGYAASAGASGDWSPARRADEGAISTPSPATTPVALMAKDFHSLWLNSAALARADGDLRVPGGVVETRRAGRADRRAPRGVGLAVSGTRFIVRADADDEWVDAMRDGRADRELARRHGRPRQGRLDRGISAWWQRLQAEGALTLRVWQSLPARAARRDRGARPRVRARRRPAARRLHQGLHGRDARLADGAACWTARASRSRAATSSRRSCAERRGPASPSRVHAIGDQANRDALDAFEATADEWRPRAACASGSSTRSCSPRRTSRVSQSSASPRRSSSAMPRPTATSPTRFWAREDRPARTPAARCSTRAPSSPTAPTRPSRSSIRSSGIRAGVLRSLDDRPAWHPEQAVTVEEALQATTRDPRLARRRRAAARASSCPAISPISSCSTATRSTCHPRSCRTCRSWPRCSAGAGFSADHRSPGASGRNLLTIVIGAGRFGQGGRAAAASGSCPALPWSGGVQ